MFEVFRKKSWQGRYVLEPTNKNYPHPQKVEGMKNIFYCAKGEVRAPAG
jgi:hypothetical protein